MILENRFYEIERHDQVFRSFLPKESYEELYVSTLVDETTIARCGYLQSFPNYLFRILPIASDKYVEVGEKNRVDKEDLAEGNTFLLYAGCMEVYPYYKAHRDGENVVFSLRSKAYRNEAVCSEIRLREFTQREFVCIGEGSFVEEAIQMLLAKTMTYAEQIGLPVHTEVASDMFFPTEKNEILKKIQVKNQKKLEVIVDYQQESLAIASVNLHDNHFSRMYEFNDRTTQSACIAFGIERWIESEKYYNGKNENL